MTTMERRVDGSPGRGGEVQPLAALTTLMGYVDNPSNYMRKYEQDLQRLIQHVAAETEQIIVKEKQEIEKTIIALEQSDKERRRYREERNKYMQVVASLKNKYEQKSPAEQDSYRDKQELDKQRREHERKESEMAKKMQELEEKHKENERKIRKMQQSLDEKDQIIQNSKQAFGDTRYGYTDLNGLKRKLEDLQKQLNEKNDQLHRTIAELQLTKEELDTTKTRLSKVMGDKLTHQNPNIADLSDKNRPTKLAERYAELYDNQWTDAYEEIEGYCGDEKDVIQTLLAILLDVHDFCKERVKRHKTHVQDTFSQTDYLTYLSCALKSTDQRIRLAGKIEFFVKECLELCWHMVIKDPAVTFRPIDKPGSTLDTTVYREYTRSGKCIEFVVWPAMLLHESGPLLAKGVAQGTGTKRPTSSKATVRDRDADDTRRRYVDPDDIGVFFASDRHKERTYIHDRKTPERRDETTHYKGTYPSYLQHTVSSISKSPKYERSPTREEMKTYFHYKDDNDIRGAIRDLGYEAYMRCKLNSHNRHLYF